MPKCRRNWAGAASVQSSATPRLTIYAGEAGKDRTALPVYRRTHQAPPGIPGYGRAAVTRGSRPPAGAVERGFVRIDHGLIHYRYGGMENPAGIPLYLAHAGPGSSLALRQLVAEFAHERRVIAPDMMGNGDSDPPPFQPTDLGFYVDCAVKLLDRLEIEQVDFYGCHTGAQIGVELAISHPDRVRRLVLDGLPLFSEAERADFLANYAPPVTPDEWGGQLSWAWTFLRDQMLHFPYYRRDPEHRLAKMTVLSASSLHRGVVDVLKALTTYHLAYHAAFQQKSGASVTVAYHTDASAGGRDGPAGKNISMPWQSCCRED